MGMLSETRTIMVINNGMDILTKEECQALIDQEYEWKELHIKKWSGSTLHFNTTDCDFWQQRYPLMMYGCINKYDVGDYAEEHIDSTWAMLNPNYRATSVWITPLNDDYEGGELYFDGDLVEQVVGVPIKYKRTVPHEIAKVTKGTRYSLVSWVFMKVKKNVEG